MDFSNLQKSREMENSSRESCYRLNPAGILTWGKPATNPRRKARRLFPRAHQFLCTQMANFIQGVSAAAVTKMFDENAQYPHLSPYSPNSVYPPCTSLGRIRCFSRLTKSITYAPSRSLLVRSLLPPKSADDCEFAAFGFGSCEHQPADIRA